MDNKIMITIDEEILFDVLCDFAETERNLHEFLIIIKGLTDYYEGEGKKEVNANLNVINNYLKMIQDKLKKTLSKADEYFLIK